RGDHGALAVPVVAPAVERAGDGVVIVALALGQVGAPVAADAGQAHGLAFRIPEEDEVPAQHPHLQGLVRQGGTELGYIPDVLEEHAEILPVTTPGRAVTRPRQRPACKALAAP